MADDVQLSLAVGVGDVIGADDIGGVKYQLVKNAFGALDTLTLVTASVGLPTSILSLVPGVAATSLGKAEDAAHSSGDTGVMLLAVREATATDLSAGNTDGDYEPLQVGATGRLWVAANIDQINAVTPLMGAGNTGTGSLRVTIATDQAQLTNKLLVTPDANSAVNVAQINGTTVLMGAGNTGTGSQRVTIASDQAALTVNAHAVTNAGTFAVQENGSQVQVDDAAFTPATSKIMMAGFEADESSTDSVDEGDGGAARMTLDRKQIVTPQPHTAGGLSIFMASGSDGSSILTNAAQVIKASAGQLYFYYIYNPNSSAQFVHFYNTAAGSVTVGTTNPLLTLTIPATAGANVALEHGITFSNAGWSVAATATAGGNGAPSTGLDLVVGYV